MESDKDASVLYVEYDERGIMLDYGYLTDIVTEDVVVKCDLVFTAIKHQTDEKEEEARKLIDTDIE